MIINYLKLLIADPCDKKFQLSTSSFTRDAILNMPCIFENRNSITVKYELRNSTNRILLGKIPILQEVLQKRQKLQTGSTDEKFIQYSKLTCFLLKGIPLGASTFLSTLLPFFKYECQPITSPSLVLNFRPNGDNLNSGKRWTGGWNTVLMPGTFEKSAIV